MTGKRNISWRPFWRMITRVLFAIADHVGNTGRNIKWDHFDILASGKTDYHFIGSAELCSKNRVCSNLCRTRKMTLPLHPPIDLYLLINIPSLPVLKEFLDINYSVKAKGWKLWVIERLWIIPIPDRPYRCKDKETFFIQELQPALNSNVSSEKLLPY